MISWEEVTSVSSLPAEQEALCLGSCLHPPLGTDPPPPAITKDSAMLRVDTTQTCSVSQSIPEHSNWSGCACYSLTKGQSQFSWSGCM